MALAGLAANYSDSEEEFVNDSEDIPKLTVAVSPGKSTDFLTGTFDDTSSSDSEQQSDSETYNTKDKSSSDFLPNPLAGKDLLPTPAMLQTGTQEGTVFGNKFALEEKAKVALYEKHVKMTEDKTSSKLPCFKFRKGSCRKGDSCRFSHDRGFQAPGYSAQTEAPDYSEAIIEYNPSGNTTKKRVGVTNTLFPAKKSKQVLDNQRAQERPWTVKNQE